jgi:hypothetical protein
MQQLPTFNNTTFSRGILTPDDPFPNWAIDITVPANEILLLKSITIHLDTDATVSDRFLRCYIFVAGALVYRPVVPLPVPASENATFFFAVGMPADSYTAPFYRQDYPLPDGLFLYGADHINIDRFYGGANDQLRDAVIYYHKWTLAR